MHLLACFYSNRCKISAGNSLYSGSHDADQTVEHKAESLHLQCLEKRREVLGEEHASTLESMNCLAALYSDQGKYLLAKPLLLQCVELRKENLGEEHEDTLTSIKNLEILNERMNQQGKAEM